MCYRVNFSFSFCHVICINICILMKNHLSWFPTPKTIQELQRAPLNTVNRTTVHESKTKWQILFNAKIRQVRPYIYSYYRCKLAKLQNYSSRRKTLKVKLSKIKSLCSGWNIMCPDYHCHLIATSHIENIGFHHKHS